MYEAGEFSEMKEAQRWWLAKNGKVEGPLSQAQLVEDLKAKRIEISTYLCPVGLSEWRPLKDWSDLASLVDKSETDAPPEPPVESYLITPLYTNTRLPKLANWICIYAILLSPASWFHSLVATLLGGFTFKESSNMFGVEALLSILYLFVSLILTGCLFVGGLKLRTLQKFGGTLIMGSVAAYFIVWVLYSLLTFIMLSSASETELSQNSVVQELISYFALIIGLGELLFLITTFLWLRRNSRFLPLD